MNFEIWKKVKSVAKQKNIYRIFFYNNLISQLVPLRLHFPDSVYQSTEN